ncbi:hypothetical protein [Mycobacterium sp. M26]|uniref:hypothetical protein n=1 Tax=Mycobacterium sp. M26 TaxID=1762962 RepID=UPI00073EA582|nr:hypothetical protein [Mycobacterium sp. M26]
MTPPTAIRNTQRLLIGHGALLIFFGGVAGFGFLFYLLGRIDVWPFPVFDVQLPGSEKAWRMTHLEAIINGLILWILALLLPLLPFGGRGLRRVSIGMIGVGWMFSIASLFDAIFPNSRGLYFGGPLTNRIPFFLFYVGIVIVMVVLAMIAWRSLVTKRPTAVDSETPLTGSDV